MDEMNSVRDMKSSPDGTPPILPNLEVIGRDKAHGSRRMLTRPWQADATLSHLMTTFITGNHCLLQRLEHSPALHTIFTRHASELERGFLKQNTDLMISLRAAKHRFESVATPLSTWCMWYPALLKTAREIIVMRSGVEVVSAAHLLQEISTKHCASLAMMADAADDALACIRSNDNCETMDIVRFNTDVFLFLVRVTELYAPGKVVHMFSYTKIHARVVEAGA